MRFLLFLILFPSAILAQNGRPQSASIHKVGDSVLIFVNCDAEYPGGHKALTEFIQENASMFTMNWADTCTSKRTYTRFVVEATGELTNIEVIRGVSECTDNEILCLIERMPKWIPACDLEGNPIRSWCTLPIILNRNN